MDSEMTQDILFESELKYFSRLKHADTVGAIKAFKKGVLYHGEDCNRGPKNDPPIRSALYSTHQNHIDREGLRLNFE